MPARSLDDTLRDTNTLYVFSTPQAAVTGSPSFNPTCLKWQTLLKLAGVPFETVASNNHASPTGALPFLLPRPSALVKAAAKEKDIGGRATLTPLHHLTTIPVPVGKLEKFALDFEAAGGRRIMDISDSRRVDAYQALLDTRIRTAWLHNLYLAPDNTELLLSLYIEPVSRTPLVRAATLHNLRQAAESEILKATHSAVIDPKSIYASASQAVEALEAVLGDDEWFFEDEAQPPEDSDKPTVTHGPSSFDAAVFAYTHLLLDSEMGWADRRLAELVAQSPALVRHRDRILEMCWPKLALSEGSNTRRFSRD